jgi:hypothetical protein
MRSQPIKTSAINRSAEIHNINITIYKAK